MRYLSFNLFSILSLLFFLVSVKHTNAQATFYGANENGGKDDVGVVFSVDYKGENYTKIYEFGYKTKGLGPSSKPIEVGNGKLYGTTQSGGDSARGVLFEYDFTTNTYKDLYSFGDSGGGYPQGELITGNTNTTLFGVTTGNGRYSRGTLFSYDINTNTYTVIYHFGDGVSGSYPSGFFVKGGNGLFYGTLRRGGANNYGALFSYDPINKIFAIEHAFSGAFPYPIGALTTNSAGKIIYGTTERGGNNNGGVLYSFNISNKAVTKLSDISYTGAAGKNPYNGVVLYNDTAIYGAAYSGGLGDRGTLFKYSLTNNIMETLANFDDSTGSRPFTDISISKNKEIIGTTSRLGRHGNGAVFSYNLITKQVTPLAYFKSNETGSYLKFNFIEASNGKWYATIGNGYTGNGVIGVYDPQTKTLQPVFNFGENSGGLAPSSALVEGANGKLYGLAYEGGKNNNGTIYEIDPATKKFTEKIAFDYTINGADPVFLAAAPNGKIYGATQDGANNYGYLFEYDPSTNTIINKVDLSKADIYFDSPFILGADGLFYSYIDYGGKDGDGFIFTYQPGDTQIIEKASFWGTTQSPRYGLIQLANGNFMGTLQNGNGGFFEYDVANDTIKNIYTFTSAKGSRPSASPFLASDGNIYGSTRNGGDYNRGTFYKLDYNTSQLEALYHLQEDTLRYIYSKLSEGDSGIIIGTSRGGGTDNRGVVFTYNIKTKTMTRKQSFSNSDGYYTHEEGFYKYCELFDGGITIDKGISLETKTEGDKYQWYNCLDSTPVLNANTRNLVPPTSSRYGALVAKRGCTYQTDCENLFILSVDAVANKKLSVYPNPANTTITIDLEGIEKANVEIYNSAGQKVSNAVLGEVNISALPTGLYFIVTQNGSTRYTSKFIKN